MKHNIQYQHKTTKVHEFTLKQMWVELIKLGNLNIIRSPNRIFIGSIRKVALDEVISYKTNCTFNY